MAFLHDNKHHGVNLLAGFLLLMPILYLGSNIAISRPDDWSLLWGFQAFDEFKVFGRWTYPFLHKLLHFFGRETTFILSCLGLFLFAYIELSRIVDKAVFSKIVLTVASLCFVVSPAFIANNMWSGHVLSGVLLLLLGSLMRFILKRGRVPIGYIATILLAGSHQSFSMFSLLFFIPSFGSEKNRANPGLLSLGFLVYFLKPVVLWLTAFAMSMLISVGIYKSYFGFSEMYGLPGVSKVDFNFFERLSAVWFELNSFVLKLAKGQVVWPVFVASMMLTSFFVTVYLKVDNKNKSNSQIFGLQLLLQGVSFAIVIVAILSMSGRVGVQLRSANAIGLSLGLVMLGVNLIAPKSPFVKLSVGSLIVTPFIIVASNLAAIMYSTQNYERAMKEIWPDSFSGEVILDYEGVTSEEMLQRYGSGMPFPYWEEFVATEKTNLRLHTLFYKWNVSMALCPTMPTDERCELRPKGDGEYVCSKSLPTLCRNGPFDEGGYISIRF